MIVRQKLEREEELYKADQAWFESDAPDNVQAIREINEQAETYGLVRTREYWLQQFSFQGRPVYRGFCFRLETADLPNVGRRLAELRKNDVVGISSAQIVREMRDGET